MTRQIETDEQYQKSLLWLVAEAERLENEEEIHDPLLRPADKTNLLRRYNFVEAGILEYQKRMNEQQEAKKD
jgi:hypothetical protein